MAKLLENYNVAKLKIIRNKKNWIVLIYSIKFLFLIGLGIFSLISECSQIFNEE